MSTVISVSWLGSVYHGTDPFELAQCIDSIYAQDYREDVEIILVIDGPISQNVEELIASLSSTPNLVVVRLARNLGLGLALKEGFAYSRGRYIARFDADDINVATRLSVQVDVLESDPSIDIVCSSVFEFQDLNDDTIKVNYRRAVCSSKIESRLLYFNTVFHPTVLMRSSALRRLSLCYEDCPLFEDYLLWLRLLNSGAKFASLDLPLVYMRVSPKFSRRHGINYCLREFLFYLHCLRVSLLPKRLVPFYLLRLASRLIPSIYFQRLLRRRKLSQLAVPNPLLITPRYVPLLRHIH